MLNVDYLKYRYPKMLPCLQGSNQITIKHLQFSVKALLRTALSTVSYHTCGLTVLEPLRRSALNRIFFRVVKRIFLRRLKMTKTVYDAFKNDFPSLYQFKIIFTQRPLCVNDPERKND